MSARKLAVQLLNRTEQEQSYSNLLLDSALSQSQLDDRDKRLCASLYYGVIERRITLDAVISHYSKQPLRKLDCTVRNILRLGIYQLLYCDQIPSRAAVNESVKLTKTCRKASASGFVNAVLRGFLRDECKVPYPKGKKAAMVVEYAVPQWLLEKLLDAYGEETTRAFLADALQPANRFIRQNPAACTGAELEQALGDAVSPTNLPGAYELHTGDIRKLPEFRKGWFYVQDLSSQICALALGAKPGETILDLCAAPGGKTCTIAAGMAQSGMVYAFDLAAHRVKLIQDNVKRLGLQNVTASQGDAAEFREEYAGADRVLCVMCLVPASACCGISRRSRKNRRRIWHSCRSYSWRSWKTVPGMSSRMVSCNIPPVPFSKKKMRMWQRRFCRNIRSLSPSRYIRNWAAHWHSRW